MENWKQRKEIQERLSTEDGIELYRKWKLEPEPVFVNIKHNSCFKRFSLRGLSKNTGKWGLVCAARNLKKWARKRQMKENIQRK